MRNTSDDADDFSPEEYWHGISDAELLTMTFLTGDPEALDGLVLDIPLSRELPFVETAYNVKERGRKARCAYCKHEHHYRGFVMRMRDGRRFLLGILCGGKRYGADFKKARKAYQHARDRADLLHRRERLKKELPAFLAYLGAVGTSGIFTTHQEVRRNMWSAFPRLCGELKVADRAGGDLLIGTAEERDYAAERMDEERYRQQLADEAKLTPVQRNYRRDLGYTTAPPQKPLFKRVQHVFGTVKYPRVLEPASLGTGFYALADRFAGLPYSLDLKRTNNELALIFRDVRHLLENIETIIDQLQELVEFFGSAHLEVLAAWATSRADIPGNYAAIEGGLECSNGRTNRVRLPSSYQPPNSDQLVAFRNALYQGA